MDTIRKEAAASAIVQDIYEKVLLESSKVLRNCKLFSIDILKLHDDPTYREIADRLNRVCRLIDFMVEQHELDEHIWTQTKAKDYTQFVADVSKAIAEGDDVTLKRLVEEMDKRSFL